LPPESPEPPAAPAAGLAEPAGAPAPASAVPTDRPLPADRPVPAGPLAAEVFGGIVFDLDGTLIDSRRDIAAAVNSMRAERDLAPLTVNEVSGMVGEGARMLVRRALPPGTGKDDLRQALASYLAHYAEVCVQFTRPYPGVAAMLATLAPSYALAVLSNKGEALSRHILKGLGLDRYLREVVGGDTLPTRKPNPGGLFLLADRLAVPPPRLLLVGDSRIDAETAQAAGSPFALTLWGGAHAEAAGTAPAASETASATPAGKAATAGAGGEEGIAINPRWRLAQPRDLPAALGLAENGEDVETGGHGEGSGRGSRAKA
jgi:phosphoglycolate phosphatase